MVRIKAFWNAFKNFAILLSFIMNFVLILVLLVVVQQIFAIKAGILEPLVTGLHSSFVGLGEARIITNIKVEDTIPVKLDVPLDTSTVVTLTQDVPIRVPAGFTLSDGTTLRGTVALTLPTGLALPVALKLNVPIDQSLPITLNVPVDIALSQTQLNDVAHRLEGLFDPLVRLIGNLPNDWNEAAVWIGQIMAGTAPDIWGPNHYTTDPWPGFTTGLVPPDAGSTGDTGALPPTDTGLPPVPSGPTPTLSMPTPEGGQEAPDVIEATAVPPTAEPTQGPSPTPVEDLGIITATPAP
jgi:hypothetical protein